MIRLVTALLAALLLWSGPAWSQEIIPATVVILGAAKGGLGGNFSASTGILYDAAGTFSALACASSSTVMVGGAPPTCTATPSGLTSLSAGTLTATTGFVASNAAGYVQFLTDNYLTRLGNGVMALGTTSGGVDGRLQLGAVQVGLSSSTVVLNIRVYAASITPAQTAASLGVAEQTFTVTGLSTTDVVFVNGPVPTALCPPVTYRVSATNTLAIGFADLTAGLCTPAAGTFNIWAFRS